MNEIENNYLEHHGILNQKWGKRNGPPYPLDRDAHSAAEKKTLSKSLSGGRNEEMYDRKAKKKEAKSYTKELNKKDKALAYEKREAREALEKYGRYDKKISKKEAKGKEVSDKLRAKSEKARENLMKELDDVRAGKEEINKILSSIDMSTFDVKAKETARCTNTGKDWVIAFTASAASKVGMGLVGAPFYLIFPPMNYEEGTKYKVKQRKAGEER